MLLDVKSLPYFFKAVNMRSASSLLEVSKGDPKGVVILISFL